MMKVNFIIIFIGVLLVVAGGCQKEISFDNRIETADTIRLKTITVKDYDFTPVDSLTILFRYDTVAGLKRVIQQHVFASAPTDTLLVYFKYDSQHRLKEIQGYDDSHNNGARMIKIIRIGNSLDSLAEYINGTLSSSVKFYAGIINGENYVSWRKIINAGQYNAYITDSLFYNNNRMSRSVFNISYRINWDIASGNIYYSSGRTVTNYSYAVSSDLASQSSVGITRSYNPVTTPLIVDSVLSDYTFTRTLNSFDTLLYHLYGNLYGENLREIIFSARYEFGLWDEESYKPAIYEYYKRPVIKDHRRDVFYKDGTLTNTFDVDYYNSNFLYDGSGRISTKKIHDQYGDLKLSVTYTYETF